MTAPSLEDALAAHAAGRLDDGALADALATADLVLAVTGAAGTEGVVDPFVFQHAGQDSAAAFTSLDAFRRFTAGTPFVRVPFRALAAAWPDGLTLVIDPSVGPSVSLRAEQLRAVAARGSAAPAARVAPAGSVVRIGAPEPGLPADAVTALHEVIAADADVVAAYPVAWADGDAAPRLVVGVRLADGVAAEAVAGVARRAAARDPRFGGVDFVRLRGRLLSDAQQYVEPVV